MNSVDASNSPAAERSDARRGPLSRAEIAARLAADLPAGAYVNLGIGQSTTVGRYIRPDQHIVLHSENGMLGMGPEADAEVVDPDLINAGKVPVTELPGASYFDHAVSLAMIRGGPLDVCVLGAFQVSGDGDLANWHSGHPGTIPAVGGAMDLASGARRMWVMMNLFDRAGRPKLVPRCTFPLTGRACVIRIYTELAVFDVGAGAAVVTETFGCSVADLADRLDVPVRPVV